VESISSLFFFQLGVLGGSIHYALRGFLLCHSFGLSISRLGAVDGGMVWGRIACGHSFRICKVLRVIAQGGCVGVCVEVVSVGGQGKH
jgi:hypothetical protein